MHRINQQDTQEQKDEKSMWVCTVLDCHSHVYYDAPPQSGVGRNSAADFSCTRVSFVLLLNSKEKPASVINTDTGFIFILSRVEDYALSTRPDFRHDVQTYIFLEPPSVLTLTDFTFDFHIFGVFL